MNFRPSNITVYNCTSGSLNPIRWGDIETMGHSAVVNKPFNDVLWYPGGSFKTSKLVNNICTTAFQILPAYLMDIVSRLTGRKPM